MTAEVVVTGTGMVCTLGEGTGAVMAGLAEDRQPAVEPMAGLEGTLLAPSRAAALPPLDPRRSLGRTRQVKFMSRAALLGCLAAREAMAAADPLSRYAPDRIGLYVGSGLAAGDLAEIMPMLAASLDGEGRLSCRRLGREGLALMPPLFSFKVLANIPGCLVSIQEGLTGPNLLFNSFGGQGAAALVEGWHAVRSGQVDAALVGGADDPAHPVVYSYLRQRQLIDPEELPGPGAAYLVLERREPARERALAGIATMGVDNCDGPPTDPLAPRLGRTCAAAPALALAIAVHRQQGEVSLVGEDLVRFTATLEALR